MDGHEASSRHARDGSSGPEYSYYQANPPFALPPEDDYFEPGIMNDDALEPSFPHSLTPLQHPNSPGQPPINPPSPAYSNNNTVSSSYGSWNPAIPSRPRAGSTAGLTTGLDSPSHSEMATPLGDRDRRPQRPSGPARTPSSTYDPPRRPPQFISVHSSSNLALAAKRPARRDPVAQYQAQEKAYVQRVRQGLSGEWVPFGSQGLMGDPDADSEPDNESPASDPQFAIDPFELENQTLLDSEDAQPTLEDLQDPKAREKLEWHSMLASVLKGDVVRQEKQRLINTAQESSLEAIFNDIWFGVKARRFGRTIAMQRKIIEYGRSSIPKMVEDIIAFEIKGETEVGKPPLKQVEEIVEKIQKVASLYSSTRQLEAAHSRTASEEYRASCDAIIAWHNTTLLINTQLTVLQKWVGNADLDFTRTNAKSSAETELSDEGSFLDRILKEDALKSLQGKENMLHGVETVIQKAKSTLIENSEGFAKRHLPPYIEELLTLINFPSRLVQEVIRIRLSYAKKMKDPGQQSSILVDQMLSQFQILMKVAVEIKHRYVDISSPEPGWELPPCVDEHFDAVVVDALKFYFRLLNWKLTVNKNTFKEAEILEQEWDFSNEIGRRLRGGDIEVAEQFSALAAKALQRLLHYFDRESVHRLDEDPVENEKRYRQILDSVRVRQRKLFRFSRFLRLRFENAKEFNLNDVDAFLDILLASGHFLVTTHDVVGQKGVVLIASPSLYGRPREMQSILGTSFRPEDLPEDPSNPYILVLRREKPIRWSGKRMEVSQLELPTDVRMGRLRLVADGPQPRLHNARLELTRQTGLAFDVAVERRANLGRVHVELNKIKKTAFKLSNTIIDSVDIIRNHNRGTENHELIQSCFAFATEFGKRSLIHMDINRRSMNHTRLVKLGVDWISFICDDCDPADRRTFKWAVAALEFAMVITHGRTIVTMDNGEYNLLRTKVAGCMSLLISHFDIMGARSTLAAKAEKQRADASGGSFRKLDLSRVIDDAEASDAVQEQRSLRTCEIEQARVEEDAKKQALGKVLEGVNEPDRSLAVLSSSATNVTLRWQQGQFIGGGTSGSVYVAIDLDTGYLLAVKEIRLQEPSVIPGVAQQIRDEMGVLEVLDHPNIVSYHGIEVHRDKVYIFMEYCSGGSLATLLEHGRIEDETVVMVYTLQMLEGLAYLHQSGIVHRDIKPANILLDHNGVIKYVDFGAAMVIARQGKTLAAMDPFNPTNPKEGTSNNKDAHGRRNQKSVTGTPMYMSPELVRGESDHSASRYGAMDIWSLGCVILEMVTGLRPWAGIDNEWAIMYKIAQGNRPNLSSIDQISDMGVDFIKRCFELDPVKRPSAAELLQHEWIVTIRRQVVVEPQTPSGSSETGSSQTSSAAGSRQNSSLF